MDKARRPPALYFERVKALHEHDLRRGFGRVYLPLALERRYPSAAAK